MDNNQSNQQIDVEEIRFENLQPIQDLNNTASLIETYIKGHSWSYSYNCITELRKINKFHPEFVPAILEQYGATVLDLLNTGKTQLVKNILHLVKELFDAGQQVNVEKAVYAFLPILIKKAATDVGLMKTYAQEVLTSFSANFAAEHSCDKNAAVAELSIKLLAAMIQKVGAGIMQLNEKTLTTLMRSLSFMIDGKRQTTRTQALEICLFMCDSITSNNYLQLMQFCLKEEEVKSMGVAMESQRQNKAKPMRLKEALRERQTQNFNQEFFNQGNNFIDLKQNNQNFNQNQNYNNQNYQGYNQNQGYNQGYSQNYY